MAIARGRKLIKRISLVILLICAIVMMIQTIGTILVVRGKNCSFQVSEFIQFNSVHEIHVIISK